MRHVLESKDTRLNMDGAPRRYYAPDYQLGACVVHDGVTYQVRDCDGVAMFVNDNESHSGRQWPGEKLDGLQSDHRGITQARSSEGGNVGQAPDMSIRSREPAGGNTAWSGAGEHGALDTRSVMTPRHSLTAAS